MTPQRAASNPGARMTPPGAPSAPAPTDPGRGGDYDVLRGQASYLAASTRPRVNSRMSPASLAGWSSGMSV
jgi:hypothetical protein